MKDLRRHKRVSSEGADISCRVQFTTEVSLINISSSGASISLNKQLNMGQEYSLNVKRDDNYIIIRGIVVWERLVTSEKNEHGEMVPVYKAGIKFDNILTDKGAELIDFIDKNFIPSELKSRLRGIRVEISGAPKDIITNNLKNFNVLKVSLSGILLETDQHLESGDSCWMELDLTDEKIPIKFMGRVVSSSEIPDKEPKQYETGMEIIKIDKEDKSMLKDFIKSLQEKK